MINVARPDEGSRTLAGALNMGSAIRPEQASDAADGSALLQVAMLQMLDGFMVGALVTDIAKRVLCRNESAASMLRRGDALTLSHGKLRAAHPRADRDLHRLIEIAATPGSDAQGGFFAVERSLTDSMIVLVRPIRYAKGGESGSALVLVRDPTSTAGLAIDGIKLLYGFTPAEARLVAALLQGQCLKAHAQAARISRNTVKTQLQAVFQKTGYTRQSELISGILRDPLVHLAGSGAPA